MMVPGITVITRPTRIQGLRNRWATLGQARFLFKNNRMQNVASRKGVTANSAQLLDDAELKAAAADADEDFQELQDEDQTYQQAIQFLQRELQFDLPVQIVSREYLPTFNFGNSRVVVVVGQDGLVANAAKYAGTLPIVALNPDPQRIDGILLPFQLKEARKVVQMVLNQQATLREVTLAQAVLQDGQRLLAFNDLFIGAKSHVSARYELSDGQQSELQSSSGIIISTGAGSTGWWSSLVNMANGLAGFLISQTGNQNLQPTTTLASHSDNTTLPTNRPPQWNLKLNWEDQQLLWAVREPFVSKSSQAKLVAGMLQGDNVLEVTSQMPADGVIFSDGVEQDFLTFNTGTIATIGIADHYARLVTG